MGRRLTIEYIREQFENEGYELLTKEYTNNTKLDYICPKGHKHSMCWGNWQQGRRCAVCANNIKLNTEYVRGQFEKEGYQLLTTKYKNNNQKLDYVCPEGHRHYISWNSWQRGSRCFYCANNIKHNIEFISSEFKKEGYKLLTKKYKNAFQKLDYICPKGHKHSMCWGNWQQGRRCAVCAGRVKKTFEEIQRDIINHNYQIKSTDYVNSRSKLHLTCSNGHDYYVSWNNWFTKSNRCPKCNKVGTSKQELDLINLINSIHEGVIEHDREIIKPYELDIVIPSKKIAIEYCGLYWHSELAGKDRKYHLNKLNLCNEKGYKLITVFEDEWLLRKNIVISRLKNILGVSLNTIYARKCKIREILVKDVRLFCEENHLQGYGSGASIKIGAFYNDELVSVMTFSKPSLAKGYRKHKEGVFELHRFCSKLNYRVVGIASKLLKHFKRNYDWSEIFSYADRRWSDGNVYEKLGLSFIGETQPNYWYIDRQKRIHRFVLRKKPEEPKNITEWDIRQIQGWNRIWDCGNLKYQEKYKEDQECIQQIKHL